MISKRPAKHLSGYWEFPGGKVEENETPERAIIRSLRGINININGKCIAPLCFSEYKYKSFNLLLLLYVCRSWEGSLNYGKK